MRHAARFTGRMPWIQSFEPQFRDHEIAEHPHRVEVRGSPGSLSWPDLCANCGAPAGGRIAVPKVFRRTQHFRPTLSQRPGRRLAYARARIPFCINCIERHRRQAMPMSALQRAVSYVRTGLVIPLVGSTAFAFVTYDQVVATTPATDPASRLVWALFGFFAVVAAWSAVQAWRTTRQYRIARQSEITLACDFSDNIGNFISGRRRAYAMRNAAFATAFVAANRERLWAGESRARGRRREVVVVGLIVGGLFVAWLVRLLQAG